MNITVFNGSPKGRKGNTHVLTESFLDGFQNAGGTHETVFLKKMNINSCKACFACWSKSPGKCVIDDDMNELIKKVVLSDYIGFATPLYTDSVTAITKNFMERLIPLLRPDFELKDHETRHVPRHSKMPGFVILSNCGYPEFSQFQVLSLLFNRFAREVGAEVSLEILRPQGELLKTGKINGLPSVVEYLGNVRKAGSQLAEKGSVDTDIQESLKRLLMPADQYREKANAYWRKKSSV